MAKRTPTDTESVLKLVIDGKQAKASAKELQETFIRFNAELNNMKKSDDPKLYAEKAGKVQQLKKAWLETKAEIAGTTKQVKSFSDSFSEIAAGVFGGNMLTRVWDTAVQGVTTFITKNAELSDEMAGVIKTTGLSEAAVDRLNNSFKKIDTRTARTELLGLAQVAGKLGYSAEADVEGFVRAADKIGVALGEDLGGTEEAINSIGKLVDIFKINDTFGLEESLLKVGSAINELGASGTAKESYLIDFTQRLAGIAPAADISMTDVLGLAATLDELGQSVEASSTAVGQFIVQMGNDVPRFAKIAGMAVADFSKLLRQDANEAFLRVLENSNSAGGGIQKLAENMGLLEVAGARGIASLGALSGNVDKLREKQETASASFAEGTSIISEFDNVNNTLAANLDKIRKNLDAVWENSTMKSFFTWLTGYLAGAQTGFEKLNREIENQTSEIAALEKETNPLIDTYHELQGKVNKSKEEHELLQTTIQRLAETFPSAISQVDQYGNAISISTYEVRRLIEAEKLLLQQQNKRAIRKGEDDARLLQNNIDRLRKIRETGEQMMAQGAQGGGAVYTRKLSNSELAAIDKEYHAAEERLRAHQFKMKQLGADVTFTPTHKEMAELRTAETQFDALKEKYNQLLKLKKDGGKLDEEQLAIMKKYESTMGIESDATDTTSLSAAEANKLEAERKKASDKEKARREKEANEIKSDKEKLAEFIRKNDQELLHNTLEDAERELAIIHAKYDEKRRLAHGSAALLKSLADQELKEVDQLNKKIKEKGDKEAAELDAKKAEVQQKIKEAGLGEYELEIELTKKKYDDLIELAKKYGLDITEIVTAREAALLAIDKDHKDRGQQEEEQRIKDIEELKVESRQLAADTIFQINENSRRARFDKERGELERDRERELSNKNLTEAEKTAIEQKYDKKTRALKREEFKADQKAAVTQAVINMALAIAKANPNPFQMAFASATGLAQIAVIASQKAPEYAKGGFLPSGPSHAQGGIDLWDKRRNAIIGNIEGGEPILSRATYANNRQIVDELLYSSQRKAGARIRLNPEILDAERMVRNGGYSRGSAAAPVVNVSSPGTDTSTIERILHQILLAQKEEKEKQVIFSNRAFEQDNAKKTKLKNSINA